jgi:hypothetical protein
MTGVFPRKYDPGDGIESPLAEIPNAINLTIKIITTGV